MADFLQGLQVEASALPDRAAGRLLTVTHPLLCSTQDLPLQTTQHLALAAHQVSRLLLHFSGNRSDGPVDLVCVHAGLSFGQ